MAETRTNPWKKLPKEPLIAPSLLACDFTRVGQQIDQVITAGADLLHVDIMDGHFVPNLSMGPGFVASVRGYTQAVLDVHLMVADPAYYIEKFALAGADSITFHIEACDAPARLIARIRELGLGVGITLKPATKAQTLQKVVADVDMVLVMTVEPGYGGQEFMDEMLPKIKAIRSMLRPEQRLEVDGGINPETAGLCANNGADVYVAGYDVFRSQDIKQAVLDLRNAVRSESTR